MDAPGAVPLAERLRLMGESIASYADRQELGPHDLMRTVAVTLREMSAERPPDRVGEAEAIIAAMGRKITAMYNSDFESSWPKDDIALIAAYEQKYGVSLEGRGE